jgi:hypothetical protein
MRLTMRLLALCILLTAVAWSSSCDKMKVNIPGKVQGQLLSEGGQGQGYMSVQLVDPATQSVTYQMTTEDTGNFMFESVEPGKYQMKTLVGNQVKCRNDAKEIRVSPGKTVSINVVVWRDQPEEAAAPPA